MEKERVVHVLAIGEYMEYTYVVVSYKAHRNGYVLTPEKVHNDISNNIRCHGGITFNDLLPIFNTYTIGFDCNHLGDASYDERIDYDNSSALKIIEDMYSDGSDRIMSTEECAEECKSIIDQLIELSN